MSTHNVGFYEDLTKIIFQLHVSSNIKYAPYLFSAYAHKKGTDQLVIPQYDQHLCCSLS